jgi:hypothetical protein
LYLCSFLTNKQCTEGNQIIRSMCSHSWHNGSEQTLLLTGSHMHDHRTLRIIAGCWRTYTPSSRRPSFQGCAGLLIKWKRGLLCSYSSNSVGSIFTLHIIDASVAQCSSMTALSALRNNISRGQTLNASLELHSADVRQITMAWPLATHSVEHLLY